MGALIEALGKGVLRGFQPRGAFLLGAGYYPYMRPLMAMSLLAWKGRGRLAVLLCACCQVILDRVLGLRPCFWQQLMDSRGRNQAEEVLNCRLNAEATGIFCL